MLMTKIHRAPIALRQRFQRIAKANEGVAAVEFALILPIMLFMFIGVLEISHAVTVDRRVSQVTSSIGDLVARAETLIPSTMAVDTTGVGSVEDIMQVGGYLMDPYRRTTLKMTVSSVVTAPAPADPVVSRRVKWRCTSNDVATNAFSCDCVDEAVPAGFPSGLLGAGDGVIMADVEYGYTPIVFGKFFFLKDPATPGVNTSFKFKDKIYQKPRGVVAKLKTGASTQCG
jgi:Flp pilus assembly protein TadG